MSTLANDIYMLIVSHTNWKKRLNEMINAGEKDYDQALKEHANFCQWVIDNTELEQDDHARKVVDIHEHFHQEAQKITQMVAEGKANEALSATDYGSEFERLSQSLVQCIIAWHDKVTQQQKENEAT